MPIFTDDTGSGASLRPFATEPGDYATTDGPPEAGVSFRVYTALTGGSVVTDLYDLSGSPITAPVSDSAGRFAFQANVAQDKLYVIPLDSAGNESPGLRYTVEAASLTDSSSGGGPVDLTGLATKDYVDAALAKYIPAALFQPGGILVGADDGTPAVVLPRTNAGAGDVLTYDPSGAVDWKVAPAAGGGASEARSVYVPGTIATGTQARALWNAATTLTSAQLVFETAPTTTFTAQLKRGSDNATLGTFSVGTSGGTLATETFTGTSGAWPGQWTTTAACTLSGNKGALQAAGSFGAGANAYLSGMTATADCEAYAEFDSPGTIVEQYAILAVRTDGNFSGSYPSNGYFAEIDYYGGFIKLFRATGGTATLLVTQSITITPGTAIALRLNAIGSTIKVRAWNVGSSEPGTWLITSTDGTPVTNPGKVSITAQSGSAVTARTILVDNLTVTTPTGSTTTNLAITNLAAGIAQSGTLDSVFLNVTSAGGAAGLSVLYSTSRSTPPSESVPVPDKPVLAGAVASGQVTLSWAAVAGATTYTLTEVNNSTGAIIRSLYSGGGLTYIDTAVVNGNTYYYELTASNASGSSSADRKSFTPVAAPSYSYDSNGVQFVATRITSGTTLNAGTDQLKAEGDIRFRDVGKTFASVALEVRDPNGVKSYIGARTPYTSPATADSLITLTGQGAFSTAGSYSVRMAYKVTSGAAWVTSDSNVASFTVTAVTPPVGQKTKLLTQFHDTSVVIPMEAHVARPFNGACLFNDAVNSWSQIAAPWYADSSANKPSGWYKANPSVRGWCLITQAPFPGSDWSSAASGANDANIRAWAQATLAAFGPNAIIRLGHEMNSWVQQYAWGNKSVAAANYVAACRHFISVAKSVPGHSWKWSWCVLLDGTDPTPWYWGDDLTDYIDVDWYGGKYVGSNPTEAQLIDWVSNSAPQSLRWLKAFCESHNKAYGFGEYAMVSPYKPASAGVTTRGSGDHGSYIDTLSAFIQANNGVNNGKPAVYCAYHSYFNRTDGGVGVTLDGNSGSPAMPNVYARYTSMCQAIHTVSGL